MFLKDGNLCQGADAIEVSGRPLLLPDDVDKVGITLRNRICAPCKLSTKPTLIDYVGVEGAG